MLKFTLPKFKVRNRGGVRVPWAELSDGELEVRALPDAGVDFAKNSNKGKWVSEVWVGMGGW